MPWRRQLALTPPLTPRHTADPALPLARRAPISLHPGVCPPGPPTLWDGKKGKKKIPYIFPVSPAERFHARAQV